MRFRTKTSKGIRILNAYIQILNTERFEVNKMKKISLLLASILIVFTITACGSDNAASDPSAASEDKTTVTVTIDIDFPDDSNAADVDSAKLTVNDGSSVLGALEAYADSNGGEILLDKSSGSPYVTSINGVAATETAGWVYEVNDKGVMKSADEYIIKDGDTISWDFESWTDNNN